MKQKLINVAIVFTIAICGALALTSCTAAEQAAFQDGYWRGYDATHGTDNSQYYSR